MGKTRSPRGRNSFKRNTMMRYAIGAVMATLFLLFQVSASAENLSPGEKHSGRIVDKRVRRDSVTPYMGEVKMDLKAGQGVTLKAIVVGDNRLVSIDVLDGTGALVGRSAMATKDVTFRIEEANDTGAFTVQVYSDKAGPYTLHTESDEEDEAALEAAVKRLKEELAAKERKLKRIRDGKAKKDK